MAEHLPWIDPLASPSCNPYYSLESQLIALLPLHSGLRWPHLSTLLQPWYLLYLVVLAGSDLITLVHAAVCLSACIHLSTHQNVSLYILHYYRSLFWQPHKYMFWQFYRHSCASCSNGAFPAFEVWWCSGALVFPKLLLAFHITLRYLNFGFYCGSIFKRIASALLTSPSVSLIND